MRLALRTTRTLHTSWTIALVVAALGIGTIGLSSSAAGADYTVTAIEGPPEAYSVIPWGLNDMGEVVGWSISSGEPVKAFHWTEATGFEILPVPPGQSGYIGREVSNSGIIAGGDEGNEAWTFFDDTYNIIGTLPGHATADAWGINDDGDTVGTADPSSFFDYTAFYYDAGLDEIIEIVPWPSRGYDVNNAGVATGYSGTTAFRWSVDGGIENLGVLDSVFAFTVGFAINENGDVVGGANSIHSDAEKAFIFTDGGGMQEIPGLGAVNQAWGVNDVGAVVGESSDTGSGDKGWIWTAETGTQALTSLIPTSENMSIIAAYDVNNVGQIIALAFDNDIPDFVPVLLTPGADTGIPCEDIQSFQAGCTPNGRLRMRVIFTDGSHTGETITFSVDGDPFEVTIQNNRAQLAIPNQGGTGEHVIDVIDPAGCTEPIVTTCN